MTPNFADSNVTGVPVSCLALSLNGNCSVKHYAAYAVGAALVDTEIQVTDAELSAMGVEKGMMTLVDQDRQRELLAQLSDHLTSASHASGGSVCNITTSECSMRRDALRT